MSGLVIRVDFGMSAACPSGGDLGNPDCRAAASSTEICRSDRVPLADRLDPLEQPAHLRCRPRAVPSADAQLRPLEAGAQRRMICMALERKDFVPFRNKTHGPVAGRISPWTPDRATRRHFFQRYPAKANAGRDILLPMVVRYRRREGVRPIS